MKFYYIIVIIFLSITANAQFFHDKIEYSDLVNGCSDNFKEKLFVLDFDTPNENIFKWGGIAKESTTISFAENQTRIETSSKVVYNDLKSKIVDNCKKIDFIWNEDIKSYEAIYKCPVSSKNIKSSTKIKIYKNKSGSLTRMGEDALSPIVHIDFYYVEIKCNSLNSILNIDNKLNLKIKE